MKDLVTEIWQIRELVNDAIDSQDEQLFRVAQKRFQKLYNKKVYLNSISTSTIDYEPFSVEDMQMDREENFAVIAFELHKDSMRVKGEYVPIEFQFASIFEVLWWSCWMLDNCDKNAKQNVDPNSNIKAYKTIEANLRETINYYQNFHDANSIKERESLIEIYNLVVAKYKDLYEIKNDNCK